MRACTGSAVGITASGLSNERVLAVRLVSLLAASAAQKQRSVFVPCACVTGMPPTLLSVCTCAACDVIV
jgi:hypothetical protein